MCFAVSLSIFIGETKVDEIHFWLSFQITVSIDHYIFRLQVIEGSSGSVYILENSDKLVGDLKNFLDSDHSFELT